MYPVAQRRLQRVRASITELMKQRGSWPKRSEWKLLAPGGLWAAIEPRNSEWALAFGHRPQAERRPPRWTEDAIEHALVELAGPDRVYPRWQQFADAGLRGLYDVITRTRSQEQWAARLGLTPAPAPRASDRPDLREPRLLAHLMAAGSDGITARRLAAWLGNVEYSVLVAGRLRSFSRRGL